MSPTSDTQCTDGENTPQSFGSTHRSQSALSSSRTDNSAGNHKPEASQRMPAGLFSTQPFPSLSTQVQYFLFTNIWRAKKAPWITKAQKSWWETAAPRMVGATDGNGIAESWCMAQKQKSQEEGDCKALQGDAVWYLPAQQQHHASPSRCTTCIQPKGTRGWHPSWQRYQISKPRLAQLSPKSRKPFQMRAVKAVQVRTCASLLLTPREHQHRQTHTSVSCCYAKKQRHHCSSTCLAILSWKLLVCTKATLFQQHMCCCSDGRIASTNLQSLLFSFGDENTMKSQTNWGL